MRRIVRRRAVVASQKTGSLRQRIHRERRQPVRAVEILGVEQRHGGLEVPHRRVTRAGKSIALSPREFDVLQVLMQEPGRAFSRTELCERVWQRDHQYETRTVEIFITRLRRKIETDFGVPLIHTVRTVGYAISEVSPAGFKPLTPPRA